MLGTLHHVDGRVLTQDELDKMTADATTHENFRKKLWCDVAAAVATNSHPDMRCESMTDWADAALAEFDKRFGWRT
jgi:hypothetical protein